MDRIPEQITSFSPPASASLSAAPGKGRRRNWTVGGCVVSALPWLTIAGLLWAGLFVKPQPVGASLQPPVLERRDHYYGLVAANGMLLAAGSGGKILRIDPSAEDITRAPTPTGETLQDVATWDGVRVVAVGNAGVILVSADGGTTWSQVADVPRSEIANKLARVRTAPGGIAVATGEMGALLMSHDFGGTWMRIRDEEDLAWNDVALIGEARMVVVGEFGRILVSEDGGATWAELSSPVASSLMAVAFRDGQHGVAVGLEGVVLTTRDGGLSWTQVETDIHVHLFDVSWDAANARWIGAGALGRWIAADAEGQRWQSGRLDERDLSWHTRVLPVDGRAWFAGANVGRWDGQIWAPLGY
ncbi:WD40/YVTN/BNR-like repeat-containing protein [Thauera sp. Sel9]|uniref:WD40/YVTN/BNR-like repeat-containing protein n=1 Tax=Thauera sp. Sel9 TaxID=2974299 RepID=UPI0021E14AC1|nr:YCF48-related protein [Thauera sp. Sel9]MCV2219529.1 YCF48-related protein [Thauera sp. Sel9]